MFNLFKTIDQDKILSKSNAIDGWLKPEEARTIYDLSLKYIKKNGLAGEVGTWKGKSSYIIASICKYKSAKLITIDTFAGLPTIKSVENKKGGAYNEAFNNPNRFLEEVKNTLKNFPVKFLKMESTKAHKYIKDKSLDFCFIDGDHTNPIVTQDIKNFLPKVKSGGVFLGHDYYETGTFKTDVKEAVDTIIGKNNIHIRDSIWIYYVP